ncbi:MAG: 4-alpha-glucanotransferase [Anaerovibrio sp.]|uniref:4-alpha-glucanotransferase n=1 Tax=Anaerovibrio sp. TaxID=1872532 RepID=UPI0025EDB39F|nr:4-alpha-glucanotransferase [Anaerovibrio sp.]MCR5176759.1 4-alpha-glucanotransferase [Anaerovibrio sp.]
MIKVTHDSQNEFYRCPMGAAEAKSKVHFRLGVQTDEKIDVVKLRVWQDRAGETCHKMEMSEKGDFYEITIKMPEKGTLLWYYFILDTEDRTYFYCNNDARLGGLGMLCDEPRASYQITVYNEGAKTPDWFKHSVMYQIFPDRFYRKGDKIIEKPNAIYHASWKDTPRYFKDIETGDIMAYDFFGGNFAGIKEKLGYLKELGISVVYLNPIFKSASNHHYDTADYLETDPILGTNEEFAELCAAGKEMGIRFILDGVFSHTGADSIYFNKFGTYDSVGACQSKDSPYYSWYSFIDYPNVYESWWGFTTLPNVKEENPAYMDFIIHGDDSVLHYWNKQGISGWRLDVIDELPEQFSQAFYKELKETDPDAVLIGEVWEDASNKTAYGVNRHYLCGYEIDSAMNYPFRQIVLDFLLGHADAHQICRRIRSLQENYPPQNFYAMMNLLGSHDRERIITLLGEAPPANTMSDGMQAAYRLDEDKLALGKKRLKQAMAWQMTFPGVPSIYYGDEISMQGYRDPYCRCPYDWEQGDEDMRQWCKKLIHLRNENPALQTGQLISVYADGDVYGYARIIENGRDVFDEPADNAVFVIIFNRSAEEREISVDVRDLWGGCFADALENGEGVQVVRDRIDLTLQPNGVEVYKGVKAQPKYTRQCGVLMHPTSFPSKYGIGDFGPEAYKFVDFLAKGKQNIWQILPLTPVDDCYSPYASPSAFAGNTMLISPDKLMEIGLLEPRDLQGCEGPVGNKADYKLAKTVKRKLMDIAAENFFKGNQPELLQKYEEFCKKESYWLDEYALFKALSGKNNDAGWFEWEDEIKRHWDVSLIEVRESLAEEIKKECFAQFMFAIQWHELKQYSNDKGIQILGDMPIFVSLNSADVWGHQELFKLDRNCKPYKVAGVPPDYFSETGQLWGNPQYDWAEMQKDGYSWWIDRMRRMFDLVDMVRIDHFRGFEAFWEIDGDAETAIEGVWRKGPGKPFFDKIREALGNLPIVAEDLGVITDEVEELREQCGFPGMKVLQFELHFNGQHRINYVAPENCIVYTGTHDNNTSVGWFDEDADIATREAVAKMLSVSPDNSVAVCKALVEHAYGSAARMAIIPVWDLLTLDGNNRMNMPGTADGNWSWRMLPNALTDSTALWLAELAKKYNR